MFEFSLIAFASTAKESNYVKPVLTEDSVLDVKGGRHPLQELCVNPFIPNDIAFNGTSGQMKILTGPNASGKSVYLKQVGRMRKGHVNEVELASVC